MTKGFILGTVQFGLDYGISNLGGKPQTSEVARILETARIFGIRYLDTAPAYGNAEIILGKLFDISKQFSIVTKTPALSSAAEAANTETGIEATLVRSLEHLCIDQVNTLMLHNPDRIANADIPFVCNEMLRQVVEGRAQRLGVSIYTQDDLRAFGKPFPFQVVQLPLNILDQSHEIGGTIRELKSLGVEIHIRSAFLQGLVLMKEPDIPDGLSAATPYIRKLHKDCQRLGVTPLEAALAYIQGVEGADYIIVGVETAAQLSDIASVKRSALELPWRQYHCKDINITDPRRWPKIR